MSADVANGLLQSIAPSSLTATVIGAFLGLVVGMIPGLTISMGIIVVLPLTFVLDPNVSIALLLGLYVAGMTGGSFSAILLNIPGTPSAAATAIDGYQLARGGEAGRALGLAIASSFAGGMVSFLCLYFVAPSLAELALSFTAADLFCLVLFGLTLICSFASRSLIKGLLAAAAGLAIATVGQDFVMGTQRFTFGEPALLSGIHFLTALIGLFAIPQLVDNLRSDAPGAAPARAAASVRSLLPRLGDLIQIRVPLMIGSLTGAFLGVLPGAGGPIAAFLSYDYAKKLSPSPERFGKGAIGGVSAPEAANNAVAGGALVPMMTLGIPGDPVTAILIGALLVHGLAPGPLLFLENGAFAYGVIFSFLWANVFNLLIALLAIRFLVGLLRAPKFILMPMIGLLCVIGSYALRNSLFDVYVMFAFGLIGLAMRWLKVPVIPLLLALVLGPQFEEHLRVALTGSQGDIGVFFATPFSLLFLCLSAVSLGWSLWAAGRQASLSREAAGRPAE